MNFFKKLFKITAKIILKPLGKETLKYHIQKSFSCFIDCKDNPKTWQAFDTFLSGTIVELIRIYCTKEINTPTLTGFLNW